MSYTDRVVDEQIFLTRNWYAPDGRTWRNDAPVPAGQGYKLSDLPSTAKLGSRSADPVWKLRGETNPASRTLTQPKLGETAPAGRSDAEVKKMISDAVEAAEQDKDEEIADLEKEVASLKKQLAEASKPAEKK